MKSAIETATGGPLTFGEAIWAIRTGDGLSLARLAKSLGVSPRYLSDVEKNRRMVNVTQATQWAEILGYPGCPVRALGCYTTATIDALETLLAGHYSGPGAQ